ncbi:flippase [Candidatus Methanoperedens nitratireducens]|uniref:Putative Membrane protein involved in the export of O-antigen and teichoic acid n=1 Tax=Candidatus Methanoperedens nitratireducens TaxID=1392998 RepID=A0A284VUR7_9EURY|nr:flippase [Candidatus Methanoperedens nitroreducens]SNQ62937.1 putative Membrane protein involved in the export of O-antigen and teichoic acid [Candidatus Methanoperedens nitroreducens]
MGALALGTLYFILVQIVFLASGYAIHAGLGRMLGPELYGTFGVVISLVTMFNFILTTGLPQAASRHIALDKANTFAVKRAANKIMLYLSTGIFLAYFLLADMISSLLLDPGLAIYIRISAIIIPVYAFYSLYTGFLNGLREFGKQAKAMISYNIAKVAGIFALVLMGFSVGGAIAGFALAPLIGLIVAGYYFKPGEAENGFKQKKLVDFAIPVIISSVAFNALMSLDLFFVKRIIAGDGVGYYTAASNLSRLPFYALTAMGTALFPAIAASRDREQIQNYLTGAMKYLLIMLFLIVALISATSGSLVTLFYSSKYIPAALPLNTLIFGLGFLTLFSIFTTVITATGRAKSAMLFSIAVLPVAFIANAALVPVYGLEGAAMATTIAGFLGFIAVLFYVHRIAGKVAEPRSVLRVGLASVIVFILISQIHVSPILLPALYIGMSILYFGILVILKEVGMEDLNKLKESFEGRKL